MGALSGNAQNVNGTGETVGQMKQAGVPQSTIQQFGTSPNIWQNLVKGGATGLATGLKTYGQQSQQPARAANPYFYGYGQGQ